MNHYSLLNILSLDAGSWADWFSGTMSFAAVITALFGYKLAERHRRLDQRLRERQAAETVGFKAFQVLTQTGDITRHIKSSLKNDKLSPDGVASFVKVRPQAQSAEPIQDLNPDEISFLLKADAAPFLMELMLCIARYRSVRVGMQEYKTRYEAFFELLPSPIGGDASRFKHYLTGDQMQKAWPYMAMLDTLLKDTATLAQDNIQKSAKLLQEYHPLMTKHFGKWHVSYEGDYDDVDLAGII